nr:alpha/beta hydrolase [Arboricoccus pini]
MQGMAGRGRSGWHSSPHEYAIETFLINVQGCLALPGRQRIGWIGTSMGRLMGMALAVVRPEAVRSPVLNDIGLFFWRRLLHRLPFVGEDPVFTDVRAVETHLCRVYVGFGALSEWKWQHLARHSIRHDQNAQLRLYDDPAIGQEFKSIEGVIDL